MADVNVTVMIDGKPAYSAGAVGTPDGAAFAITALQHGLAHFTAAKLGFSMLGMQGSQQAQAQADMQAARKQDNSL